MKFWWLLSEVINILCFCGAQKATHRNRWIYLSTFCLRVCQIFWAFLFLFCFIWFFFVLTVFFVGCFHLVVDCSNGRFGFLPCRLLWHGPSVSLQSLFRREPPSLAVDWSSNCLDGFFNCPLSFFFSHQFFYNFLCLILVDRTPVQSYSNLIKWNHRVSIIWTFSVSSDDCTVNAINFNNARDKWWSYQNLTDRANLDRRAIINSESTINTIELVNWKPNSDF